MDALNTDTVADLKSKIHSADGGLPTYKQKLVVSIIQPVREKTNNLGYQVRHKPGRWSEDGNFGFRKKRDCTIRIAKTKALISFAVMISFAVTAKLICAFVFE